MIIVRFLSFASLMDENMEQWPQTETGSQTGACTLLRQYKFEKKNLACGAHFVSLSCSEPHT